MRLNTALSAAPNSAWSYLIAPARLSRACQSAYLPESCVYGPVTDQSPGVDSRQQRQGNFRRPTRESARASSNKLCKQKPSAGCTADSAPPVADSRYCGRLRPSAARQPTTTKRLHARRFRFPLKPPAPLPRVVATHRCPKNARLPVFPSWFAGAAISTSNAGTARCALHSTYISALCSTSLPSTLTWHS